MVVRVSFNSFFFRRGRSPNCFSHNISKLMLLWVSLNNLWLFANNFHQMQQAQGCGTWLAPDDLPEETCTLKRGTTCRDCPYIKYTLYDPLYKSGTISLRNKSLDFLGIPIALPSSFLPAFLPSIPVHSLISRPAAFAVKAFLRGPVSSAKFSLEILAFKWIQPENNQTPLLFLPISPYSQIQQSHPISSRRQRSLISLPLPIPYLSVF